MHVPANTSSNNNEQRNVDELGVTFSHWSQLLSWRELAKLVVRMERFFRMLRTSSLIQCEHAQTNVHLPFLRQRLAFKAAQELVQPPFSL